MEKEFYFVIYGENIDVVETEKEMIDKVEEIIESEEDAELNYNVVGQSEIYSYDGIFVIKGNLVKLKNKVILG